MTAETDAIKTAIIVLTAQLALLEKKPVDTYYGGLIPKFDTNEAERKRLEEIANSLKPHEWRNAGPGVLITEVGDNDREVQKDWDDLARVFQGFWDAATREDQKDSVGNKFYPPWIKQRGGIGIQSIRLLRDETRRLWYTDWGVAWRNHPLNIKEGKVPKMEDVQKFFDKVY